MKWFKHESTALKDEKIQLLLEEFGSAGYMLYFGLMELCAEKIDEEMVPEVELSWGFSRRLFHLNREMVERFLNYCSEMVYFSATISDKSFKVSFPNLLKRLDNYTSDHAETWKSLGSKNKNKNKKENENIYIAKPTAPECYDYFKELNKPLEAERFFDHYTSNGWKVGGKTAMKDWKAAARNWCRNSHAFKDKQTQRREKLIKEFKEMGNEDVSVYGGSGAPFGSVSEPGDQPKAMVWNIGGSAG